MRAIPNCLLPFLKTAEGNRLKAYRDTGGNLTIGVGHMDPHLAEGEVWSQAKVDAQAAADESVARAKLYGVVKPAAVEALSEHEYAALLSFVFNLGAKPDWTVWKLVNAGALDGVPAQLMRFDKERVPGSKALREVNGLHARRAAEVAFWKTGDVAASAAIAAATPVDLPSAALREADTPPTPNAVKPLVQSKRFVSSCLGGAATACAAATNAVLPLLQPAADHAKAAADQLAPAAEVSHTIAHARNALIVGGAMIGVATPALIWLAHRREKTT